MHFFPFPIWFWITISRECTDKGKGHSCCPRNRCYPRRWMPVPTCRCCVLGPFLDLHPPPGIWAFSVWVWMGCIPHLVGHTLHLEGRQSCKYNNKVAQTDISARSKLWVSFELSGNMYSWVLSTKMVKTQTSTALTFAESLLEAFSVDMPEDVMRLPVEVSECQLAEQLIAATEDITCQHTTNGEIRFSNSGQCPHDECCQLCKWHKSRCGVWFVCLFFKL